MSAPTSPPAKPSGRAPEPAAPPATDSALKTARLDVPRTGTAGSWLGRLLAAGPGLSRVRALCRRHWLVLALLGAGLALRVLAEVTYRPALFYIDTNRYLLNVAYGMDPVGYEGPLRALLLTGNFATVAAFQHLLGLGLAVAIYLLLWRRATPAWLAALATAPLLLDAYQIQIEQMIMPDTLFEALAVTGLAILLWRPEPGWRAAMAGGLVLGTSAIVAQVGEALLLPAVIYLLVARSPLRRAVTAAAVACAAFAVPILAYSTGSYLVTGSFFLSHTGVTSLYGRTAAAADCATLRLPAAERGMCPTPAQQAHGPDWLEYSQASPIRPYYANPDPAKTDQMITNFSNAVLTQQPLRVLAAYGRDAAKLFEQPRIGNPGDTPISRWQFQTRFPYFPNHSSQREVRYEIARFGDGAAPATWRPGAVFLRGYQLGGGYTPGPLFALAALAGLAGFVVAFLRRHTGGRTRQLARACLLFFTAGASVLLVSDIFEFSWRYQLPALVTIIPAGALGVATLISLARRPGTASTPSP